MDQHNDSTPAPRRSKLHYLAGLAAAVGVLLSGCAGIADSAEPTGKATASAVQAAAPAPVPAPVPVAALDGLLVPADTINTTMGATAMQVSWSGSKLADHSSKYSVPECTSVLDAGHRPLYDGHGWIAARGQQLKDDPVKHRANQRVVSFSSAQAAKAFVAHVQRQWSACAGRSVTYTNSEGRRFVWMLGGLSNTDGHLKISSLQEGGDGWAVQRALTVRNNVVIDVSAAGYGATDEATDVAGDIAAKVPAV